MRKLIFMFRRADVKTKIFGCIALVLALAAILLVVVSANKAINGPITEISVFELVISEDERGEFDDMCEEAFEELEDAIDELDDDEIEELEDELGMSIDEFLDIIDEPVSLNSVKAMASISLAEDEMKEVATIFSVIVTVIKAYAIILAVLVAFSMLFFNKGFFITSVVLSSAFFLVVVGVAGFFIFLALCIAFCILQSKVKKAYKLYKNPPAPVAEESEA